MTKREVLMLGIIAGLIAVAIAGRKPQLVPIPLIVTRYDTVRVIDTAWVATLKRDTVYKTNIVERVVTTPPKTVTVVPPLNAVTSVSVGKQRGDSSLLLGVSVLPKNDGTYTIMHWERQFWTPGPLHSIRMVGQTPAVTFYDPPPTCPLKCKAHWAGGAVLVVELLRTVFGRP